MRQKYYLLFFFVSLTSLFTLTGCGTSQPTDPQDPQFIVAKGNGVQITRKELTDMEKQVLEPQGLTLEMFPPDKLQTLESNITQQLVQEKLVLQDAQHTDLSGIDDAVQKNIEKIKSSFPNEEALQQQLQRFNLNEKKLTKEIRKKVTIEKTLADRVPEPAAPSDEQIKKFYEENTPQFQRPETIRASHILILVDPEDDEKTKKEKKKQLEKARKRILKGEDFGDVAHEVSQDQGTAPQGGDLNYFPKGTMVPEFEKVAFSSKKDELSPIFETPYGYHFLKVTDLRPGGTIPLSEAKTQIANFLTNQTRGEKIQAYLEGLVEKAGVIYSIPMEPEKVAPSQEKQAQPPTSPESDPKA